MKLNRKNLNELFHYDEQTGFLFWRERDPKWFKDLHNCKSWNKKYSGEPAGYIDSKTGYVKISVLNKRMYAHRIVYAMLHGDIPKGMVIDHQNKDKKNNKAKNLVLTTSQGNNRNMKLFSTNTSGVVGVYKTATAWVAAISVNNKKLHLGSFDDKTDAVKARKEAESKYNFHCNHGTQA